MSNTSIARSRLFFGQRNYEYETHTFNEETNEKIKISDETEEQWKQRILEELFSMPETYNYLALIFHDRDIINLETNEKKVLHCHFVLRFDNPRSYENILAITKCQKRNLERSTNQGSILRYLTHTTPEAMREQKTRYNVSEIYLKTNPSEDFVTGEDLERWYRSKIKTQLGRKEADTTITTSVANLAYQLSTGKIKPYQAREELINEFGNEFGQSIYRKEKKKFQEDYNDFLDSKKREILLNGKELSTIYIEGPSEVGKSVFAQDLANAINSANDRDILDTYLAAKNNKSSSTWDWISKYKDEYVTIFNDLDPNLFGFTDFIGTFETKVLVDVSSRYKDKTWFSEYAIITKSTDINEFVNTLCRSEIRENNKSEHNNIRYQVQRRINLIIKIQNNEVSLSQFNKQGILKLKQTFTYENLDEFWEKPIRSEIIDSCLSLLNIK
ncbi:Rep family protein [Streptococcus equinus]|uniref:Rep family protein n=1 Tax=Streptococcus equinus TaxID=1335 RepID=UPI000E05F60F|nr:Rep family protein [Streptococcus equinus]SUO90245.1 Plasmid replication protein [Streptococcus equinus]SUO90259.1 Plasmid replication protein [Streptococcus equinus]